MNPEKYFSTLKINVSIMIHYKLMVNLRGRETMGSGGDCGSGVSTGPWVDPVLRTFTISREPRHHIFILHIFLC